jgi:hypothetical protein
VHALAGRSGEAEAAWAAAIEVFERKGNVGSATRVRASFTAFE